MATNQKLTQALSGRKVDSVRQRGDVLDIDFTDGSTLEIKLSGPTNSVKLTSDDDEVEYVD